MVQERSCKVSHMGDELLFGQYNQNVSQNYIITKSIVSNNMKIYFKITLIVMVSFFTWFAFINTYAPLNFLQVLDKYRSYEHVQSFQEAYPTYGISTSGFVAIDKISYTYTKGNLFVELMIFVERMTFISNDDYMELNCYDTSDHDSWVKLYTVSAPSVDDILSSVSDCGFN